MNRLIDRARDAAWMLAEYVVMNEINVGRQRMMGDEVGRVIACGSMTMPTDMMLRLANLVNALQAFIEELLESEILRLRRETPVYMYRTDPSRPERTLPFHRMHAEACASALALGLQMVVAVRREEFDEVWELARSHAREIENLNEQIEGWKRKYKAKVYHNE